MHFHNGVDSSQLEPNHLDFDFLHSRNADQGMVFSSSVEETCVTNIDDDPPSGDTGFFDSEVPDETTSVLQTPNHNNSCDSPCHDDQSNAMSIDVPVDTPICEALQHDEGLDDHAINESISNQFQAPPTGVSETIAPPVHDDFLIDETDVPPGSNDADSPLSLASDDTSQTSSVHTSPNVSVSNGIELSMNNHPNNPATRDSVPRLVTFSILDNNHQPGDEDGHSIVDEDNVAVDPEQEFEIPLSSDDNIISAHATDSPMSTTDPTHIEPTSDPVQQESTEPNAAVITTTQDLRTEEQDFYPLRPVPFHPLNNTLEFRMAILVVQLLTHARTAAGMFDLLFRIIVDSLSNNTSRSLSLNIPCRRTLIKQLQRDYPSPKANVSTVILEPDFCISEKYEGVIVRKNRVCNLVMFDFIEQAVDLFSDRALFGNLANFEGVLDISDPTDPDRVYNTASPVDWDSNLCAGRGRVKSNETQTANWYRATYANCVEIADGEPFMCIPWIIHIDKTGTTDNQRHSLEPVTICPMILNRAARNLSQSWRLLGYIPSSPASEKAYSFQRDGVNIARGRNVRDYHRNLEAILESFALNQGYDQPLYFEVQIGQLPPRIVRVFFPACFVVGDCVAQDANVGRYASFLPGVKAVCHACYIKPSQCGDPGHCCTFRHPDDVHEDIVNVLHHPSYRYTIALYPDLIKPIDEKPTDAEITCARKRLEKKSLYAVPNGFRRLHFGVQPYGLYGSTPHDLFHLLMQGLCKYAILSIIGRLTENQTTRVDKIGRKMCATLRGDFGREFPRLRFTKKISKITMLTGEDRIGMCASLLLLFLSKQGSQMLDEREDAEDRRNVRSEKTPSKTFLVHKVVRGLDTLLSLYAWYRYSDHFNIPQFDMMEDARETMEYHFRHDPMTAQMRKIIRTFVECFPRPMKKDDVTEKEYSIQNLHSLLHLPRDIMFYGSPMNLDAGICEKNLKAIAKDPAKNARKDEKFFEESTAKRLVELNSIDKAVYSLTGVWGPASNPLQHDISDLMGDLIGSNEERGERIGKEGRYGLVVDTSTLICPKSDASSNVGPVLELKLDRGTVSASGFAIGFQMTGRILKESSVFTLMSGIAEYFMHHWGYIRRRTEVGELAPTQNKMEKIDVAKWYNVYKTKSSLETFRSHPNINGKGFWSWIMISVGDPVGRQIGTVEPTLCLVAGFFQLERTGQKYAMLAVSKRLSEKNSHSPPSRLVEKFEFQYQQLPQDIEGQSRHPGREVFVPRFVSVPIEMLDDCLKEVVSTETEPALLLSVSFDRDKLRKRNRHLYRLKRMRTEWACQFGK